MTKAMRKRIVRQFVRVSQQQDAAHQTRLKAEAKEQTLSDQRHALSTQLNELPDGVYINGDDAVVVRSAWAPQILKVHW